MPVNQPNGGRVSLRMGLARLIQRFMSPLAPRAFFMLAIIDYQMGNLRSVQKGFEKVGHQAVVTSDPAVLAKASKVVLPGVGAFEDAICELRRRELIEPI